MTDPSVALLVLTVVGAPSLLLGVGLGRRIHLFLVEAGLHSGGEAERGTGRADASGFVPIGIVQGVRVPLDRAQPDAHGRGTDGRGGRRATAADFSGTAVAGAPCWVCGRPRREGDHARCGP